MCINTFYIKVNHRKRKVDDRAGTSEEEDDAAQEPLAAAVQEPLAAAQEPLPAEDSVSVASPSKTKKPSASTLRQTGREFKAPVAKAAPTGRPKRAATGSSSDAVL